MGSIGVYITDLLYMLEQYNKIKEDIENNKLVMFFKSGGDIYGTDEMNRIMFANMKNKDPEETNKESRFAARNMKEGSMKLFGAEDLDTIKIVDMEEAVKELSGA